MKIRTCCLLPLVSTALLLGSCDNVKNTKEANNAEPVAVADQAMAKMSVQADNIDTVLASRSDAEKARDVYRHPAKTLAFFKVAPSMSVAEVLPGSRGWYTHILAKYLGSEGALYGLNYSDDMWPRFGFFSEERMAERIASTGAFSSMVAGMTDNGIATQGFTLGTAPESLNGTVDRVLFIRALHNLNRFEADAGTISEALSTAHALLKDDGLVGVVQHRLAESASDDKANGSRGYLKTSDVVGFFEKAGFVLVDQTELNANPKDQPTADDVVWRLPPSLNGSKDDEAKKAAMLSIGESDRMTLLFKKVN